MNPLARYVGQFSGDFIGGFVTTAMTFVAGLWFGFQIGGNSTRIELAQVRETAARNQAAVAKHASRRLLEAETRGDELTTQLHVANRAALHTQEKLDDALRRATTGRACLNGPALRLLDGAHNLTVAVPPPAGGAAAGDGPAPTDSGELVSSDTDVARWIARAGFQYDECRRRLDALIDWHAESGS
ncbi:MAG: hypothetical protein AzoDbin1_03885 [Azoarcus sp.]|nr:hypothetical protein [Azoarcus sp.]